MKHFLLAKIRRRDLFGTAAVAVIAVSGASGGNAVAAETISDANKRKARYQPNSQEIQTYYRVNRYPN